MTGNFEDRYLDLLEDGIADLKSEVEKNSQITQQVLEQAKKTNGRVNKHDDQIKTLQTLLGKKRSPINPTILYWVAGIVFFLLSIVASVFFGIKTPGAGL